MLRHCAARALKYLWLRKHRRVQPKLLLGMPKNIVRTVGTA